MDYAISVCKKLGSEFKNLDLIRPMRAGHYDSGARLNYNITSVTGAVAFRATFIVEKFVGGGFAGQVYKVKLIDLKPEDAKIEGLEVNQFYAIKILVPPSSFSLLFRNALYWLGFQGAFQLQVNPAASRAGALWQKFIRRAALVKLNSEDCVVNIFATFIDEDIGSTGEISEWVDGRTWRLEVNEYQDLLDTWSRSFSRGKEEVWQQQQKTDLGSPEYQAKRIFMHKFVSLLHDIGGYEFARQYEWSTCKSQPNCLKREGVKNSKNDGLIAVDFRAGLALLPFLPMSPGDFKLIIGGIKRGSLVQFDRGDISKLEAFVKTHKSKFEDMLPLLDELKTAEGIYRNSVPDITHNHIRLLYDSVLWSVIFKSAITGWRVSNLIDDSGLHELQNDRVKVLLFAVLGLIPVFGNPIRRFWQHDLWRKHYTAMFTNKKYFLSSLKGRIIEILLNWYRDGRVEEETALKIINKSYKYIFHLPFSFLPVSFHRFFTDLDFAKQKLAYILVRPIRLYFNAKMREDWLLDMVNDGRRKHLLTNEDAAIIISEIKEPFIQKYLKSLAVHVCTLPVTQVVSVTIAIIFVFMHPEMPRASAWAVGLGIIAIFQVIPISPGSLVRGLYVLYLVIKERNFKDYSIAVFLGFFKYIGYLAFPIQMTHRYPALARFMSVHWATEAVHIVPVFGEGGALLEHKVFTWFYNWPLTIRRRMQKRAKIRAVTPTRYWHIPVIAVATALIFTCADFFYFKLYGALPSMQNLWWLAFFVPLVCGGVLTVAAGGLRFKYRVFGAVFCGILSGAFFTLLRVLAFPLNYPLDSAHLVPPLLWSMFVFAVFMTLGVVLTELRLPEPSYSMSGSNLKRD